MLRRNTLHKHKARKKGQSTVEYIVLIAAIIAALIIFLQKGGIFQTAYNAALVGGTNGMNEMATRLQDSRPPSP